MVSNGACSESGGCWVLFWVAYAGTWWPRMVPLSRSKPGLAVPPEGDGLRGFIIVKPVIERLSLYQALPPGCRLRSGRFDHLPVLESLFFAGPKKSNPKKWPAEREPRSIARG